MNKTAYLSLVMLQLVPNAELISHNGASTVVRNNLPLGTSHMYASKYSV